MDKAYAVHAPLKPMTAWVHESVFYDMDKSKIGWVKVKIFGLTCISGRSISLEVLTDDGCVFSEIPPHMVRLNLNGEDKSMLGLTELVYFNCPSEHFSMSAFDYLNEKVANVFFKGGNVSMAGQYLFSIDFYNDNNWYHCVALENGQVAFMPSHKIIFANSKLERLSFPDYKKLRHVFSV